MLTRRPASDFDIIQNEGLTAFVRLNSSFVDATSPKSVALVVGVTGMAGTSLVQALKSSMAPGSPWTVHGAARRPPPPWFPLYDLDTFVQLDALDRNSTVSTLSPLATHVTHLFWVALAVCDTEEENIAANYAMLANALHALTSVTGSTLRHVVLQTGTKHYFGPFVNSVQVGQAAPVEVPFREDSPRLPYPLFYYALEDLLATYSHMLTWTVHRSSLIFGASTRSIYNPLLTLFIYALICRREGSQFLYPGSRYTWHHFCDATDSDILADQQIWAATTTTHATDYQAFNCTNGDIFTWRSFWKVISKIFHLEFVECPQDELGPNWIDTMNRKRVVWDAIVEENGLLKTRLEEVSSFEAVYAVLNFRFQHVCSMNKSRAFGFYKSMDTLKSVRKWMDKLKNMNVIPKD